MARSIVSAVLVMLVACSTFALAQDAPKKETPKEQKAALKSVSCDPECGFMCRSHDEAELTAIVINHAKQAHNKTMTEADVKGMMKTEGMKSERKMKEAKDTKPAEPK